MNHVGKVDIPEHWNTNFYNNLNWEKRPWVQYGESHMQEFFNEWSNAGLTKENKRGLEWHFYYGWNYEKDGYETWPRLTGYETKGWWLSKIPGGCVLDMHKDLPVQPNQLRLWVALDDYITGHVFIDNDILYTNYKKGDAFAMSDQLHGAANLTKTDKISLQMIVEKS